MRIPKTGWDLWVEVNGEDKPYMLEENEGLFMYGNDQIHWREKFPNPETNLVANAFSSSVSQTTGSLSMDQTIYTLTSVKTSQ